MNGQATLRRDLRTLTSGTFDVLVIGGGASGAATAREAALRGLNTALIEREDFSAGASAHCFKVVHGGIRYMQHADVRRLRASCRERAILLRIAPHLVEPLSFMIPTYGRGRSSKWLLGAGMCLYDLLTADLNRTIPDPARRVRGTRFFSSREARELFPDIPNEGLTGAAVFQDGQMYNPPRLVLAFAAAAAENGATVANYVEATEPIVEDSRILGVRAIDRLSGAELEIRARCVINAAGPWAEGLLRPFGERYGTPGTYSRDTCFLIRRRHRAPMALAVQGGTRDSDALLARSARHLFLVPWQDCTLVGVWHVVVPRDPDAVRVPEEQLQQFIAEINTAHPGFRLTEADVLRVDYGLVPFGAASRQQGGLSFGKRSRLIDHRQHGVAGLVTLISVRYTVARGDAVEALDLACRQLGQAVRAAASDTQPLPGGDTTDFAGLGRELAAQRPAWLPAHALQPLLRNYGTRTRQLLALAQQEPRLRGCLSGSSTHLFEAIYGVRAEMAQRMTDIVFRRTDLGTAGHPGAAALDELQALLKFELGWSEERARHERKAVDAELSRYQARELLREPVSPVRSALSG